MGSIYLITTDFINGFKIGFWSGTPQDLWARYLTYYGPEMSMYLFPGVSKQDEGDVHRQLIKHRVKGSRELYVSDSYDLCKTYLIARFGTPNSYDRTDGLISPFTFNTLTDAYITKILTPLITLEVVEKGISEIAKVVADHLLCRGTKYCYYFKAGKFKMLVDHEGKVIEETDPNSQALRAILALPLQDIVSEVAEKHTIESVNKTNLEIAELKKDGRRFTRSLASSLPSDSNGYTEKTKARLAEVDPERLKKVEERMKRIALNHRRKMIEEAC